MKKIGYLFSAIVILLLITEGLSADDSLFRRNITSTLSMSASVQYNRSSQHFYVVIRIPSKVCKQNKYRKNNNTDYIHIKGLKRYTTKNSWRRIQVYGDFKPYTHYELIVDGALCGRSGYYKTSFRTKGHTPSVEYISKGLYFSKLNPVLKYRHREVTDIEWKVYKINGKLRHLFMKTEYIELEKLVNSNKKETSRKDSKHSRFVSDYPVEVDVIKRQYQKARNWQYGQLDLSKGYEPGVWYFFKSNLGFNKLVQFTNLGVTFKKLPDRKKGGSKIWGRVVQLDSGKAVPVDISVQTKNLKVLKTLFTGNDGHFEIPDLTGRQAAYLEVAKGTDSILVPLNQLEIPTNQFPIAGVTSNHSKTQGTRAFVYTDRGLYRLGETVHLTSLVRDFAKDRQALTKRLERADLTAVVKGPSGTAQRVTFRSDQLKDNAVTWDWTVPKDGSTGQHTVLFRLNGHQIGIGTFAVEQIIPPTLEGALQFENQFLKWDKNEGFGPLKAELTGKFLFGAPAAEKKWEYSCVLSKGNFFPPDYKEFVFNDFLRIFPKTSIFQKKDLFLDAEGKGSLDCSQADKLTADQLAQVPGPMSVSVVASIYEEGGRSIEVAEEKPAYFFDSYVGIKPLFKGKLDYGQTASFQVVVLDPVTQRPKPNVTYTVTAYEKDFWGWYYLHNWNEPVIDSKLRRIAYHTEEFVSTGKPIDFNYKVPRSGEWEVVVAVKDSGATARYGFKYGWWWREDSGGGKTISQKVDLKTDKSHYQVGETARILVSAPFDGRLLLSFENGEGQIKQDSIDVVNRKAVYAFPVEKDLGDWVYIAGTLLRIPENKLTKSAGSGSPVDKAEIETPYRAIGMTPLKIIQTDHQLDFDIRAPERALPGEMFSIEIQATDIKGGKLKKKTWMTVAVVDEGILNLGRFKTPDPYEGLHPKPKYEARWFDSFGLVVPYSLHRGRSTFGSDAGFEDAMDVTRIKPMAWWSGIVTTDESGYLKLDIPVGDYTGKVRVMVVGWQGNQTGSEDLSIPVFAPLDMQTSLPRVFGAYDRSQAVAEVFNNTDKQRTIEVEIVVEGPLELLGTTSKINLVVDAMRSKSVVWKLEGAGVPGKATINFVSTSGELQRTRTTELLVRPPGPQYSKFEMFILEAGKPQTFALPADWNLIPGSARWKITTSSSPVIKLGPHLKRLVAYPYGCAEQTTSRLISMILLKPVLGEEVLNSYLEDSSAKLEEFIVSGIDKLKKMQMSNGGFAYWQGGSYQYEWVNAYVTHFLWLARYYGYEIPDEMIKDALVNLRGVYYNYDAPDIMAYSGFVLGLFGQLPKSELSIVIKNLGLDTPGYRNDSKEYRIANAMAEAMMRMVGLQNQTDKYFAGVPKAVLDLDDEYWWRGSSFLYRDAAYASRLYADAVQGGKKDAGSLLQFLDYLAQKRYLSTHTAAWTLLAVNETFNQAADDARVQVTLDGKQVGEIGIKAGANFASGRFTGEDPGPVQISLRDQGTRNSVFGIMKLSGWPNQPPTESFANKIFVERLLYNEAGEVISLPASIKQGDRIFVEVRVEQNSGVFNELENVAIEDWLPAGFELENPRLMSKNSVAVPHAIMKGKTRLSPQHIDYLDDRIVLFAKVAKKTKSFVYSMKATSQGDYQVLPLKAEAMYLPEYRAMKVDNNRVTIGSAAKSKAKDEQPETSAQPYQKFIKM